MYYVNNHLSVACASEYQVLHHLVMPIGFTALPPFNLDLD